MQRSPVGRHSPALVEDDDAIRRRKLAAEKRVQERHRALLAEQKQKNRTTAEERQRIMAEMREREAKEMKKRQEELNRHLEWLERDKARKKEILERQHAATSRTATKPGIAFGSSAPRELSYLNNLPRSQQTYDKKLSPPPEARPTSKVLSTPKKSPTLMTTSMYVPSSTPRRPPQSKTVHQTPKPKQASNLMTQSFYTPSRSSGMTASAPRSRAAPKPAATPVAKSRLPPVNPKPKKVPTKPTIVEETQVVEALPIQINEVHVPTTETSEAPLTQKEPETTEAVRENTSSPLEELEKTAVSSDERALEDVQAVGQHELPVEENQAVQRDNHATEENHAVQQPVLPVEEHQNLIDLTPTSENLSQVTTDDKVIHEAVEEVAHMVETIPSEPVNSVHNTPELAHVEPSSTETVEEQQTSLFDELAAINITSTPVNDDVKELDYSSDSHLYAVQLTETVEIAQNGVSEKEDEAHKHEEIAHQEPILPNGHHTKEKVREIEEFTLPGAVFEAHETSKQEGISLVEELSSASNEKPESIEESKLITSRPPSPPVLKNEELEEISRRREDDQKHNAEIKARFAAVKARIGRISPPNVNGNGGLPPPAPVTTAPAPENGKPLSDSTAALLQRLSKMGALKSTKAAESVDALLTRHSSDPKIDQAPEDPVSLI